MSASWDSDLSSIIEKTNTNLKLLRKIGDKPQVRAPDVSMTAPTLARSGSASGSVSSHSSARPRAYVGAQDDTGSMGSHTSARPRVYVGDDGTGSVSSHSSARPKAFLRADDDSGSVSSRASARPKAFIRADDDSGSVSSRASARPKAFIRADDDSGSVSSRASARPKAFVRGDDDTGSMSSNQGLGRARLDSGHGSVASASGRPHVGIAGGGGLTAAMLQQHRASAGGAGAMAMADLGAPRPRYDLDETRSMSGASSRLSRRLGADGRVPHARPLGASMGPRIRVPDSDIPSDVPKHVIEEVKKSLETHFASRNGAVDKKVADLRTDVAGLTTQTSSLASQITELRDAVLVSANSHPSASAPSVSDPKIIASVQANAAAIARLEEHSADLLGRKVSVDRELAELGSRVKALSSSTMKISTLEDNIEALVANRQKQEQGLFKLADRVQLMHRQMGSLVDMKAVENLLSIRLTREFREMEDRLAHNVMRMAEKMEQKVSSLEKQSFSQRQESLAALKNDLSDDIQRLQSSALRKSDLLPLQNAQTQSKEDLVQLSSALDRQEKKLQDAKLASATLRDELADARTELNKALQSQQRSAAAVMEEKLEQIASSNKEKSNKFDDQLSELAKKQKKLEEATKNLQETMSQVKVEASQRLNRSSAEREEENDKLRQRLARSVAELEALATTKAEVERRFASEEQQFQARLKELRSSLTETEKQKDAQRLELMQKLQEESKLMGVAQGKNSLLENLLAREKAENEEKNELVRKSKKEVAEVREQIRNLESEKEKKVRQLTSELQAKQTQVGLLTKTLKRIETASAKMLDLSKREAKTVRRVKATKEHELFIAQLKLKEMERVAQALQNGDEMKKQAALTAASTEERNELEKLLLESQLEKDELKQELEEMTEEFNAAKESQKVIMEDTITKLSSDYDEKIGELKQQIADKEQAMRQLRDTLVEKSNLDALEDELAALKDEKNDLLEQIQRAQIEHERVTLSTETNLRLEHATQFAAMKSKFEERISELEGAQSELEMTKATITELEKELEKQEALHQHEVSTLTHDIKDARSKIDECTAQILELEETKTRLEGAVSQMEANIGGASAEKEEELAVIKGRMQAEVDRLRAKLSEVSSTLVEKQTQLKEAKQSDETNRQKLVEMAMAQEEMQSRYVSQIDSLTLKLNQERESSRAREQDLEDTIDKLNADVKSLKAESNKELEAARSELTDQMTELTTTLKASQHREQQLQSRLKRILEELVQAANASGDNEVIEESGDMSDDDAITHHLDALYATHRRTAHELERLQAEYELTVKQAAADSATAQELDSQVKEHETQIRELESVVEQLREELKEQYHKSAIIAKGSDEFSEEMVTLREEKRQLERQLQEEEKDRAKREVSYQRRTEMKEREVEELRTENKTLTAAVAAVREKIRAVENVKYHDLGELQSKLKDLEERTAALTPDENNVANLEKDFTATRQEIVTLTAEVQSLYQKLTACCGIMEWSELRASVFDEEEKLTRVRVESAREMAKVQSVEQEVLMNAEFLNALLVAHGSGSDSNLLNDFRWMQKYASIAPEIVEKLRNVESRLRDAVLDLHDGSTSVFPDGVSKAPVSGVSTDDGVVPAAPSSQNSSVDGAAIALALEKAKENYFDESEQQLDVKHDVDQPDVEQESPVDVEAEGASSDNVDGEGEDSIGDFSHDESGTDAELGVAEHVVRAEQERSREERAVAMSNLDDDEDSSDDVAEDSFKSRQDRSDDDDEGGDGVGGLESSVDRKIEETKTASRWSSLGFRGDDVDDDMDEVERLRLEQSLAHSSKQVNPRIDNECDSSDEFAHDNELARDKTEQKLTAVTNDGGDDDELDASADINISHEAADRLEQSDAQQGASSEQGAVLDDKLIDEVSSDGSELEDGGSAAGTYMNTNSMTIVQTEQSDAELDASQDASSQQEEEDELELDPLEESSFDNAMMAALEGNEPNSYHVGHRSMRGDEVEEADKSGSDGFVVQDAMAESSFDDSMMSERDEDESMDTRNNLDSDVGAEHGSAAGKPTPIEHNAQLENSFDGGDDLSDSEISVNERTLEKHDEGEHALEESTASSVENLNEGTALYESASCVREIASHAAANEDTLDELVTDHHEDEIEDSASSVEKSVAGARYHEGSDVEVSASSVEIGAMADRNEQGESLEESTPSVANDVAGYRDTKDNALEESSPALSEGSDVVDDRLKEDVALRNLSSSEERAVPAHENDSDEDSALEGSALSLRGDAAVDLDQLNQSSDALEESSASVTSKAMDEELPDNYKVPDEEPPSNATRSTYADEEPPSNATRSTYAQQHYEDNTMLGDSASSSLENVGAEVHDDDPQVLEGSALSVENAEVADQLHAPDELEESVGSVCYGDEHDISEASSSNTARSQSMSEPHEDDASASRLESNAHEATRYTHGDPLSSQPDEDDGVHRHDERGRLVVSHSDPLAESSFDEDNFSDQNEEEGSTGSEPTSQPTKHSPHDEDEDEWSEEQLRAAERSLDSAVTTGDDNDDSDSVEAAAAPVAPPPASAMSLRIEDDGDSSEEEETMPMPSQPTFSSSLSRFGMGGRGLNLEEDDDMDEVERLLLEQSQSTEKTLPQLNRFTTGRAITTDEFGETSLQSQTANDDDFGEASIQSREDDEFEDETSIQSTESENKALSGREPSSSSVHEDEFSEALIRSSPRDDTDIGEASIKSNADESGERFVQSHERRLDGASATTGSRKVGVSGVASMLSRLQDADEFSESSFKSQSISEFGPVSIQSRRHDDDEFGQVSQVEDEFDESSIRPLEGDTDGINNHFGTQHEVEATAMPSRSGESKPTLERDLARGRDDDEDELEQAGALEESPSSMNDDAVAGNPVMEESGSSLERVSADVDNALEDSASSVENAALADHLHEADALDESIGGTELDASLSNPASGAFMSQPDEDDALERLASRLAGDVSAQPVISRHTFGSRYTYDDPQHDEDDGARHRNERASPVAVSHADPLAESSFDEDVALDLEQERSVNSESTVQPTKHMDNGEDEGEWSEEQLRAAERSLSSAITKGDGDDDSESGEVAAAASAMALRMEDDEGSSEEEETMAVQSPPTFSSSLSRFGMGSRRLNLEEDDDTDEVERLLLEQSRPTMKTQRLPQLSRLTRPIATDDDEFGETSLQSQSGNDDNELGETSLPLRDDGVDAAMHSFNAQDEHKAETAAAPLRMARNDEDGGSPLRSRTATEFGEASIQSYGDDEFAEASIRSSEEDDEFGEISIPLHDDAPVGAQIPSRSLGAHTSDFAGRAVAFHEGVMSSPAKQTTNLAAIPAIHDDSASEAENDYMDESFDLDESLEEEEEEDGERHV